MTAHKKGVCVVGVFAKDIAETKAARANEAGAPRAIRCVSAPSPRSDGPRPIRRAQARRGQTLVSV